MEVYERNKKLDTIFMTKYEENEPFYFEKNCVEFLVEMGEFVNETKCFKYWSIKKPQKDQVLEEYADCLLMLLSFFGILDMDLECDLERHHPSDNVLVVINYLYREGSKIMTDMSEKLLKDLFVNLIYLAKLLNLSIDEIEESCHQKQDVIEQRLNSDY